MKLAIGNDHRGYVLKEQILLSLKDEYEFIDVGCDTEDAVDYPIYAKKVCEKVNNKEVDFGILICGTGIGMSIAANKIKNIRCAKVTNVEEAYLTRIDNDANVIALSYKQPKEEVIEILKCFIGTNTSMEERHVRRRKMLEELENDN
jgi:ribose 5-phosphate isomerase B